jgi:hypothetical protein
MARMSRRYLDSDRRDGARGAVAGNVHAEELGEGAEVLDLEPCSDLSFERCEPSGIIAGRANVINVHGDHGENVAGAVDVDARVGDALLPSMVDETCTK